MKDRRLDRNGEVARIVGESRHERRSGQGTATVLGRWPDMATFERWKERHPEEECIANMEGTACQYCGRPMTHFESLIIRAL